MAVSFVRQVVVDAVNVALSDTVPLALSFKRTLKVEEVVPVERLARYPTATTLTVSLEPTPLAVRLYSSTSSVVRDRTPSVPSFGAISSTRSQLAPEPT